MTSPSSSSELPPQPGPGRGPDRVVHIKAGLGGAGLLLGLVGMSVHRLGLVWGAVGCLGAAFLLRFAKAR
ncbi:MAG TPA: hypothetical protein VFD85_12995 [Gemmatimonadales bacterium]|nr:hypothetical protein [Gemmatimonadales bacterium]